MTIAGIAFAALLGLQSAGQGESTAPGKALVEFPVERELGGSGYEAYQGAFRQVPVLVPWCGADQA